MRGMNYKIDSMEQCTRTVRVPMTWHHAGVDQIIQVASANSSIVCFAAELCGILTPLRTGTCAHVFTTVHQEAVQT